MSSGDCEATRGPSSLQPTQGSPQMCTNVGKTGGNMTQNRLGVRKGKNIGAQSEQRGQDWTQWGSEARGLPHFSTTLDPSPVPDPQVPEPHS